MCDRVFIVVYQCKALHLVVFFLTCLILEILSFTKIFARQSNTVRIVAGLPQKLMTRGILICY